jgi:hypothetical protein
MTENPMMDSAPTPEPAPQAPQQPSAPVSEVSLEDFLSEFERETAPKGQAEPSQQPAQQPDNALAADSVFGPLSELDADTLQKRVSHAEQMMAAMAERERFRVDSSDFESIVTRADAMVRDLGKATDDEYVRRWLMAESLTPGIAEVWDRRHDSAEHLRQWQRQEAKMLSRLAADAKKIPDVEASADRLAVAAAIRGSASGPPAEKPLDVANMAEPEFRNMLRTKWGL